jgi:hypothetical protein
MDSTEKSKQNKHGVTPKFAHDFSIAHKEDSDYNEFSYKKYNHQIDSPLR